MNPTGVVWIEMDSSRIAEQVCNQLQGLNVHFAEDLPAIADAMESVDQAAVFLRLPLPGIVPQDVLTLIRSKRPQCPVLIHDPTENGEQAHWFAGNRNVYYLHGSFPLEAMTCRLKTLVDAHFSIQVRSMAENVSRQFSPEPWRRMLIGESPAMLKVIDQIRLIAPRRSTVLISGETGTGKEVVTRAIHQASGRGQRELVAFNCGALPETLVEAELFGHAKGAFTGALNQRIGRFEQANHGTIFLDEIGDLPIDLQSKLLRVLQEREFQRLGGTETVKVDVRVIAATNVDLAEAVKNKRFREDLYYRLNVLAIELPPLRQRAGDISPLLSHFIDKLCQKEGMPIKVASSAVIERLSQYSWPGNVRQLEHATETAIVMSGERRVLQPADFQLQDKREEPSFQSYPPLPDEGLDFNELISRIERNLLSQALEKCGGNKSRAAGILRMKRSTLVSKVKTLTEEESNQDA
jgi:DNA-binding NtrC family response regulator